MPRRSKRLGTRSIFIRLTLAALLFFYLGICLLVYIFQRNLLYHPVVRTSAEVNQMAQVANMERWTNSAGECIGLKRLATNQPAAGIVFMMYGNMSTAVGCARYADAIQSAAPLDFYVLEYPGYEDRPGAPTQGSLLDAAKDAFQMLDTNQPVYLVGESLGTGVAAWLAGEYPDKITGIMLLSPYDRLDNVAQSHYPWLPARRLLQDNFRSTDYLWNFHGRLGVMIDGQDEVIPAKLGHRLYDDYTGPKRLWEYPNCNHVQLGENPETFWKSVIQYWQTGIAPK